ncbi:MAG: methyltransferase domain-containing protein [Steroidobacteraceae bacterium]
MSAVPEEVANPLLKLDIGCGKNKKPGFHGVDAISFDGVDTVMDVRSGKWPWDDASVEEVHCSHFVEHLTAQERVHFVNELYRVLIPGGKCQIIVPHWNSNRAYGDPTHQWPPVSEMWFYYLDKGWRAGNAPHTDSEFNPTGFNCDFAATWGYSLHGHLTTRNIEYQQHAIQFWKEACQDTIATIVKK